MSIVIELFKVGKISGENNIPQHIATAISDVFIFDNNVYKIYKNDNVFFNEHFRDLSNKHIRFEFTRKDFDWNHTLSPEIYRELKGIVIKNDEVFFVDAYDDSEELVLVMNKINPKDLLLKRLLEQNISVEDCYQIGFQFGEREQKIQKNFQDINLYDDFIARYNDMIPWVLSQIPEGKSRKYLDFFKNFIEGHRDEFRMSRNLVKICLDIHADNALYANGKLLPMDTYAPKEDWLHGYRFINIYRLAGDIYVFMGETFFEAVLKGYTDSTMQILPRNFDTFMLIYSELIVWPYQYMLAQTELWRLQVAEKHEAFLHKLISKVH